MRSGPLKTLINSLNNKEKKKISRILKPQLLKLFKQIVNGELKQIENLPYLKNQLYRKILFHLKQETFPEKEFFKRTNDYRSNATILLERGLPQLAISELQKGRRHVQEIDIFSSIEFGNRLRILMHEYEPDLYKIEQLSLKCQKELILFQKEMQMVQIHEDIYLKSRNKLEITNENRKHYNKKITNILETKVSLDKISSITNIIRRSFIPESAIGKKSKGEDTPRLSLNILFYLYHTLYLYHKYLNSEESLLFLSDILIILSQYPDYQLAYSSRYLNLLNNVLNIQYAENRTVEMKQTIKQLKEFILLDGGLENKKQQHYDYYRILLYIKLENYEKAYEIQNEIYLSSWKQYENILPISRKLVFSYNLSCICLIVCKHDQAQFWYEKILKATKRIRPDIKVRARLIEVITLFDIDILEKNDNNLWRSKYLVEGLIRYLRSKKNTYSFLLTVTKSVKDMVKTDLVTRNSQMSKTLEQWEKNKKMENGFEELLHWLRKRCSTFAE